VTDKQTNKQTDRQTDRHANGRHLRLKAQPITWAGLNKKICNPNGRLDRRPPL